VAAAKTRDYVARAEKLKNAVYPESSPLPPAEAAEFARLKALAYSDSSPESIE
jgi:hypothetical protein